MAERTGPSGLCKLAPLAISNPVTGTAALLLCNTATTPQEAQAQKDVRLPDLFVEVGNQEHPYRTHVVPDSDQAFFRSRFIIPTAVVPIEGLRLFVRDDDGAQQSDLIGDILLTREQIAQAAQSGETLSLHDDSGNVTRLEVRIRWHQRTGPPFHQQYVIDTKKTWTEFPNLRLPGGTLVQLVARGEYSAGPFAGRRTPAGRPYDPNVPQTVLQFPPFKTARHGAAIAMTGALGTIDPIVVGDCIAFVVRTPGPLGLGVNDSDAGNNSGTLTFDVQLSDALPNLWRHPGQPIPCGNRPSVSPTAQPPTW